MTWPSAILLDFYGTVVEEDDAPIAHICGEIAKVSSRRATSEEVGSYWGRIFSEMCFKSYGGAFRSQKQLEQTSLQEVQLHFDADLDSERLSRILYEYWARPTMFPESRIVIAKCNVPICLVTNIDNAELNSALTHNELSFDFMVTSEDCRAYKPRPEPFERALSLLNLSNEEVLHVGDSLRSDVGGAKALGITVLWINRKKRLLSACEELPDHISTDLTGMLDILKKRTNIL